MAKFSKATKYNSFLKLALAGPPGSGKSYSALSIASYLSEKRIAVIDAEMGSASKYAHLFDFDVNEITLDDNGRDVLKPYSPQRYMEAIKSAYESGEYDVLIIDGITPEWNDAGGCLQWVDQITKGNDTRSAWKIVKPVHQDFINAILRTRMHIIVTMLAKKEIVASRKENGQVFPQKVTLEPIQQDDVPRVFDVFALMQNKEMIIDKTRCPGVDDQTFYKPGKEVADILREWLKGDPMPERPDYTIEPQRASNLSDIPTVSKLREIATSLNLDWNETVLPEAFEKPIADGKVTKQALIAKGDELPPTYCSRLAAYLQAKQVA
jgi:nucleoside-triphosphatase THEP1